jgi:hypothetical protein
MCYIAFCIFGTTDRIIESKVLIKTYKLLTLEGFNKAINVLINLFQLHHTSYVYCLLFSFSRLVLYFLCELVRVNLLCLVLHFLNLTYII